MIILSFLGLAKDTDGNITGYKPTVYQWDGKSKETTVFGEALLEWFPDALLYLVVTDVVKEKSPDYQKLKGIAGDRLHNIDIPIGKNETEMWDIFGFISGQIPEGEIIFDFTHGLRSSSMITLLALAYLQSLEKNNVKHLLYGAFDAQSNNITPVFDLKPMFQLLEWANAANFFMETGNAKSLAKLSQSSSDGSNIHNTMEQIKELSESLLLVRPNQIYNDTQDLLRSLREHPESTELQYKPFELLSDRIHDTFKPLDKDDELERELALLDWYIKREHWVHAVTLAREWVVTLAIQLQDYPLEKIDETPPRKVREEERSDRDIAEIWLYRAKKQPKNTLPHKLGKRFGKLANLRNDLAHFGKRPDPREVSKIKQRASELPDELRGFYKEYTQYRRNGGEND